MSKTVVKAVVIPPDNNSSEHLTTHRHGRIHSKST